MSDLDNLRPESDREFRQAVLYDEAWEKMARELRTFPELLERAWWVAYRAGAGRGGPIQPERSR